MPKLLQIDSCLGVLSTGKITEGIGSVARVNGWETYIAHGARYVGTSDMVSYQIGSKCSEYLHYAKSLLFDKHGLGSSSQTRKLIRWIKGIKPNIIHLHCVHGYYINYRILFEYLNSANIPVVWTFHDCWAFTGHCAHFITDGCERWKQNRGCHKCPLLSSYPKSLIDRSSRNFKFKKDIFTANKNLHIVAVSQWLASLTRESFFSKTDIRVIHNGINVQQFMPCANKSDKPTILGVASTWTESKGLCDFYKIRRSLPIEEYDIILVGLTPKQVSELPAGIVGIERTESVMDLAKLYSKATVFVNPTYADSFPTVNMEALACGTPVITYETGGSPEIISKDTGIVVPTGDVDGLVKAIVEIHTTSFKSDDCRSRTIEFYRKEDRFLDYIRLYQQLIKSNN